MPKIEGKTFVFGKVKARVRYKVLSVFIAAAPIVWWVFLFFMGKHFLFLYHATDMQGLNFKILLPKLENCCFRGIFFLWVSFQLLWAGRMSIQDIRTCLSGILSPSGLMLILPAVLLWQFIRQFS
ncbi:MAG: hypothetical protein OEW04_07010 [Nitrospirota bacterium]|nr:hypothetical protein [Nitrospirota bacterium]